MSFHAPNGYSRVSQTARAINLMDGFSIHDAPDTRPMPEPEQLQAAASALFAAIADNFSDTGLEGELEDLAWSLVDVVHRKVDRVQRRLDDNELKQRDLHDQQDGSEVMSTQLEDATDKGRFEEAKRDAFERLREYTITEFEKLTGSDWRPRTKSVVNHRNMTAAMIDSREMRNAQRYARTHVLRPKGPMVLFSGGKDCNDITKIWSVLDKTREKHPDMVLGTTGKQLGADAIAAAWAKNRGVTCVDFKMKSNGPNDNSAGFRRNDEMLETKPIGVIVFPGTGTVAHLARRAREMGFIVMDFMGA